MIPFPWTSADRLKLKATKKTEKTLLKSSSPHASASTASIKSIPLGPGGQPQILQSYLESSTSFAELYEKCCQHGCIGFNLPPFGALAGRALRHAVHRLESLFDKHRPLIWKVGYTHDPLWRWCNSLYGYAAARDKWSHMEVLYVSREPFGPSVLEAALIERFQSHAAVVVWAIYPTITCRSNF